MSREIWLSAQYVPGDLNVEADSASRLFAEDLEWSLHPTIFSELQSTIWSPDIDLCASTLSSATASTDAAVGGSASSATQPGAHPLRFKMRLAAWVVSGNPSQTREFLVKLPTLSVQAGQQVQKNSTKLFGKSGGAGTVKGMSIPFRHMFHKC